MRLRPGYLLAEALCALALAAVLAAVAAAALQAARRAAAATTATEAGIRAEREAVAILAGELRRGANPMIRGDTAAELDVPLGLAVVCSRGAFRLDLPAAVEGGLTELVVAPAADDLVAVRLAGPDDAWWYTAVDSVQDAIAAPDCDAATGWQTTTGPGARVLRIVTFDSVPPDVEPGAELLLFRRGRYVLYHGGRGEWMLGYRRCHAFVEACGVVQPVAGPLRTPSAGGLRLRFIADSSRLEISARGIGGRGATAVLHQ